MKWLDRFLGNGDAAVTVPSMDGALHPNRVLEDAAVVMLEEGVDNLVSSPSGTFCTSDGRILRLAAGAATEVAVMPAAVTALALADDGRIAAGLADGSVSLLDPSGRVLSSFRMAEGPGCITALAFSPSGLAVCIGSAKHARAEWKADLMSLNRLGSIWRCPPDGGRPEKIAGGLGFPYGVVHTPEHGLVVSESWANRLVAVEKPGMPAVLDDLPGYPSRISTAPGGYLLSVFAPRSQLIEFVLREKSYRQEMMRSIPQEFWIAPSTHAARTFLEPLQGGALKQLGMLKPWAPTRSYGLVIALDGDFTPVASYHSRADGVFHGVTSAVNADGVLLASSLGAGEIRRVDLSAEEVRT